MTADLSLKVGDRLPTLKATLTYNDGTPINLVAGTVVKLFMRDHKAQPGSVAKVNGAACQITDAAAGKVEYSWLAADTDTPGVYVAEFRVHLGAEASPALSTPSGGRLRIDILPKL